jgi:hypothetical protein
LKRLIIACVATALIAGAATATAGSLITSRDIQDRSIRGRDIARGTIPSNRLSAAVRRQLAQRGSAQSQSPGQNGTAGSNGTNGAQGPQGAPGVNGADGADGADGQDGAQGDPGPVTGSGNWGTINRNTIGSPVTVLRAGPNVATSTTTVDGPPRGNGSLSIIVADEGTGTADEKATYGNEVDFLGDPLSGIADVGFSVWTSGENGAGNNPNITFEVDKDTATGGIQYSSLVFVPTDTLTADRWTDDIDADNGNADGFWYYTNTSGSPVGTPCTLAEQCTIAEAKSNFPNAVLLTVAVGKGRDAEWQGAVDALRINNEVFDFEEHGVSVGGP